MEERIDGLISIYETIAQECIKRMARLDETNDSDIQKIAILDTKRRDAETFLRDLKELKRYTRDEA